MPSDPHLSARRVLRDAARGGERSPAARLIVASLLSGLVVFVWGFLFWNVLSPPSSTFQPAHDPAALSEALIPYLPESGTYFVPETGTDPAAQRQAYAIGPIATIFLRRDGSDASAAVQLGLGYLSIALACLAVALLLYRCASALPGFGSRVGVVLLAGLAGSLLLDLGSPIWWYRPWHFHLLELVYAGVGWLLAGCVLAALIKKGRLRF